MFGMISPPHAKCLGPGPDPVAVAAGWPEDRPLAALISARGGSRLARWSILAAPEDTRFIHDRGREAGELLVRDLDQLLPSTGRVPPMEDPRCPPFRGGRILLLPYELGGALEPRATDPGRDRSGSDPLAVALSCPNALVHDRVENRWWLVGPETGSPWLCSCLERAVDPTPGPVACGDLLPDPDDREYARMVERTIEYVHAGDIFQANITRKFRAGIDLSGLEAQRRFSAALLASSGAWFGGVIELGTRGGPGERTIISLSPELFLEFDPMTRLIRTRPIKGTLPDTATHDELRSSEKDAAELAMIVDLMRNDLGRMCEVGSVRVSEDRTIEHHPGVLHGVAEVSGVVPEGTGFGSLLASTFPPGSISGAPKVRAMQVIEELEQEDRGIYCGAVGFASNCGRIQLDVSIRTIELVPTGGTDPVHSHELAYGSGCGIVAESTPAGEVAESHVKARRLKDFLDRNRPQPGNPSAAEATMTQAAGG